MSKSKILVVDDNTTSTKMMSILLSREGYEVITENYPVKALDWLKIPGNRPDLIITDLNMPEMSGEELVTNIKADPTHQNTPIIMLTAQSGIEHKVSSFEAGADDYLVKPVSSTELKLRIKALLQRAQVTSAAAPQQKEATVITVFSLRGGAGTSSVAVNTAVASATLLKRQVALVDLAAKTGHCSLMLNIKSKYTTEHLLQWGDSYVEKETVEKFLPSHKSGVRLLAAPRSPVKAELITYKVVDRIWPYIRAEYPLIIIDGGNDLNETVLTALERSHHILLVVNPDLASLKSAVDALSIFRDLDIDDETVKMVLNDNAFKNGLPERDLRQALKKSFFATIPNAQPEMTAAINAGKPIFISQPTHQVCNSFEHIALELVPDPDQIPDAAPQPGKESSSPLLSKLLKRAGS